MPKKQEDGLKEFLERAQETFRDAEENVVKAFKDLTERVAETQHEARKKVDELLANLSAKDFIEQIADRRHLEAKVNEVRQDWEHKIEEGTEAFWARLGVATKADVSDLSKKLSAINKRLKDLEPAARKRVGA